MSIYEGTLKQLRVVTELDRAKGIRPQSSHDHDDLCLTDCELSEEALIALHLLCATGRSRGEVVSTALVAWLGAERIAYGDEDRP